MNLDVYRSGWADVYWHAPKTKARVEGDMRTGAVQIKFSTGGYQRGTHWRLDLRPDDFRQFLRAMAEASPDAFAGALTSLVSNALRDEDETEDREEGGEVHSLVGS